MPRKRSGDKKWAEMNRKLLDAMQRNDWQEIKNIYFEQVLLLQKEGRDTFKYIEETVKSELHQYQNREIEQVGILIAGDACPACKSLVGTVFSVSQALEKNIIPVADCKNEFCRCSYVPTGIDETETPCSSC